MIAYVFPGQGSQKKGMGKDVFDIFPDLIARADNILGYPIEEICLYDPDNKLNNTLYTQPALYVVNALTYLKKILKNNKKPDFVAGHSLGEYAALFAAEVFDFETGLKLVQKRSELMAQAHDGAMAAIIGLSEENISSIIYENKLNSIDIANYNSHSQIVISGPQKDIEHAKVFFMNAGAQRYALLNVSGAFHSRYMDEAKRNFLNFLTDFEFSNPIIPVFSNVTARPYKQNEIKEYLSNQIISPVKWSETIRVLMGLGDMEFEEIGPGNVLTNLINNIKRESAPIVLNLKEGIQRDKQQIKDNIDIFSNRDYLSNNIEETIVSLFNSHSYIEQPEYIAIIGCDLIFVKRIYDAVKHKSLRGHRLKEYPLTFIGIDLHDKNIEDSRYILNGIDHILFKSDIFNPEHITSDLKKIGIVDNRNILYVLPFMDIDLVVRNLLLNESEVIEARIQSEQILFEYFKHWSSVLGTHGIIIGGIHNPDIKSRLEDADQKHRGIVSINAESFLMALSHAGLFPHKDFFRRYPQSPSVVQFSMNYILPREYMIRYAVKDDLPALVELEKKCWDPGLQISSIILAKRIEEYPEGQLVLEIESSVVGAVYSQRIVNSDDLKKVSAETVQILHTPEGALIQLLAINILPEMQHKNLGDELLEFMLQKCSITSGVDKVVGVTRCKDYHKHHSIKPEEYIRLRNKQGSFLDTILRLHEMHGAQIKELIPEYRPNDLKNMGYGVLVEYNISHRKASRNEIDHSNSKSSSVSLSKNVSIENFIRDIIIFILGKERECGFLPERPLMEMGLDSADLLELNEQICSTFLIRLEPAFFFKYNTAQSIISFLEKHLNVSENNRGAVEEDLTSNDQNNCDEKNISEIVALSNKDIAIVGIACRLPGGISKKEELWELLISGKDAISKMPQGRWIWPYTIDPDNEQKGIDMGGFLDDIACFDASFFRISPREAELIDPQQRILLELSWECFEDAGYSAADVSGSKTGVFIGASGSDYNRLLETRPDDIEAYSGIGTSMAVLPNRISYFYDFYGPSIQIDTACSSSLVAMHTAVKSLQSHECQCALVGGINIMCHPSNSIVYYKAGMLAQDGRCKTFDKGANGYVRGEGAVLFLLKPLQQAYYDKDSIYAVIKGSAINHGGQASGLTVPNPAKQSALLVEAYESAGFDPETVGYIEVHGTGTSLGDPIEITGLKDAFSQLIKKKDDIQQPYCGLGSIKTNIGHLEAAAGIAGLLKVILCMQHNMLPSTLHFHELNPRIDLAGTPFFVVNNNMPWQLPNGQITRRGGVSSFGSGGTNAHVILEQVPALKRSSSKKLPYYLICMSAKTKETLKKKEEDLLNWLGDHKKGVSLADISSTLLLGREHFDVRVAFVVRNSKELIDKLRDVLGNRECDGYYYNNDNLINKKKQQSLFRDFGNSIINELHSANKKNVSEYYKKFTALAELYIKGYELNWKAIFTDDIKLHRIDLPTYPFLKERYWVEARGMARKDPAVNIIHPLLHRNRSDLFEQRFSSRFTGHEFFLADHVVKGERILPGVAYLEMVREAAARSIGDMYEGIIRIENVVWIQPLLAKEIDAEIHIGIYPADGEEIEFEIYSESDGVEKIYSQGRVVLGNEANRLRIDVNEIQKRCVKKITSKECYDAFKIIGFDYGPGHRGIDALYVGENELLANLLIPSTLLVNLNEYILHPSIMDAGVQASLMFSKDGNNAMLPFALDMLEVYKKCESRMWAYIEKIDERSGLEKVAIDYCDSEGNICIRMKGLSMRKLESTIYAHDIDKTGSIIVEPVWKKGTAKAVDCSYDKHIAFICDRKEVKNVEMHGIDAIYLEAGESTIDEKYKLYAGRILENIQKVIREKNSGKVLLQIIIINKGNNVLYRGLGGLLRTAELEDPKIVGQIIEMDELPTAKKTAERLVENSKMPGDKEIRYDKGKRFVKGWKEIEIRDSLLMPWKEEGIYLITGGAGGLGLLFAREIADKAKGATIILTGRSELNEGKIKQIQELAAQVEYKQADVSNRKGINDLLGWIRNEYGDLNGIIHAAGIIKDNFILKKGVEELEEVISPKVTGVINLDELSAEFKLDFFILFSSTSGALGNIGQADYACGNAFMDEYAAHRNDLVKVNKRSGQTLSIVWPLWEHGGMQVDSVTKELMKQSFGIIPMKSSTGIQALYRGCASQKDRVMVFEGNLSQFNKLLSGEPSQREPLYIESNKDDNRVIPVVAQDILEEKSLHYFKKLLSSVIKLPVNRIDADAAMERYGIDSMMVMQLTNQLEKTFGSLPKTLFFEYQNIRSVTRYFLERYRDRLIELLGVIEDGIVSSSYEEEPIAEPVKNNNRLHRKLRYKKSVSSVKDTPLNIAIIGIAGRYPQARNIREFWKNLCDGKDCITEIPKDRWDYSLYFHDDKKRPGKTYSKWGGFLSDVDKFDALFFNITPKEAELIDPQERLFLECVYETLEDAGYTREYFNKDNESGYQGKVGVYAGVMYEEYQLYGAQETALGRPMAIPGNPSSIANRVSYFFNFHGPSMTIDTMCSSSLTAIHLACHALRSGECEAAIAGGVNLSIHPNKYLFLAQGRFISSKGLCESFGIGADGYVPGEGVGAVLLKPLLNAVADEDHIYGIIKATAINHGGKTNGFFVPNPRAQADVISRAFKEAGINPRAISYIEAHGTGTSLGDPIEIAGLTKAFNEYTEENQFCAIGSAKSNIGHCESAAGIAGVTKILLQFKHRQIVPSLHSKMLNPNIDFSKSPFVVQQDLEVWKRPLINMDGEIKEYPRIAGISSFGAGGSNAHVIIEEFDNLSRSDIAKAGDRAIIVLSAKDNDRLQDQVKQLLNFLHEEEISDSALSDIAYTLQVGREPHDERLAFIVSSLHELEMKLKYFLDDGDGQENIFRGQARRNKDTLSLFGADEDLQEAIEKWIRRKKYEKLIELWVKGLVFDWNKLYGDNKPRRMSLPVYPFAKERYWVQTISEGRRDTFNVTVIHPLLHRNVSDFLVQRFSSTFRGDELFIIDHVVSNKRILSGLVCLEMVREALYRSIGHSDDQRIKLKNIVWSHPIVVPDSGIDLHVELYQNSDGTIEYEIYTEFEDTEVIHSQGKAVMDAKSSEAGIDIQGIQQICKMKVTSEECYKRFEMIGINYGQWYQCIEHLYVGEEELLASLKLPQIIADSSDSYILHPCIMEAGVQIFFQLMIIMGDERIAFPYELNELEIYKKYESRMWAYVKKHTGIDGLAQADISLCNEKGEICIRMKGLSVKHLNGWNNKDEIGSVIAESVWKEEPAKGNDFFYSKHLVIICNPGDLENLTMQGVDVICLDSEDDVDKRFVIFASSVFDEIKKVLKDKSNGKVLIQIVYRKEKENALLKGLGGLLKTAELENPRIIGQIIEIDQWNSVEEIIAKVIENKNMQGDKEITYDRGKRFVHRWEEIRLEHKEEIAWKDGGIYLITGGAGGLGFIFAQEIALRTKNAGIILTGRSIFDEEKKKKINRLHELGARVEYRSIDVADKKGVMDLVEWIHKEYGGINGIIHAAGIIRDNFILRKGLKEFEEVLLPKVTGVVNLDEATKNIDLDFFVLFSSISGALGNAGQADYACGNAFMDEYAKFRNSLVMQKKRFGHTLSINWPLWEEGGMRVDEATERIMRQTQGLVPMKRVTGMEALYNSFSSFKNRVMVFEGDVAKIRESIFRTVHKNITPLIDETNSVVDMELLKDKILHQLKVIFSEAIKLDVSRIDDDKPFENYGIDSVMISDLNQRLADIFGNLSKTLFYEYPTLKAIMEYLVVDYKGVCMEWAGLRHEAIKVDEMSSNNIHYNDEIPLLRSLKKGKMGEENIKMNRAETRMPIAIIGMSGHYPQASTLIEYWENLKSGKDCITEIPEERWSLDGFFHPDEQEAIDQCKSYSKWGGFLDDFACFDPLFFNISPKEALNMDPQERLFIECCWKTIEDAGYTKEQLAKRYDRKVGVFVGITKTGFDLYGPDLWRQGEQLHPRTSFSSVANRISYILDIQGPSMPIDTMCSSSLIAIHEACEHIHRHDCKMALAGGVNLYLHPSTYIKLCSLQMISRNNICAAFGQGGNGFVPGEGVGSVLLKPLEYAERDGDHIYAVLLGSHTSHGGKSNGYMVPNPNAQKDLILENFRRSGVDPRSVTYIESAAYGSDFGDPIEITAITKVYSEATEEQQFCAIGSVKPNIGHLEAASGISQLHKVIMQLQHGQLAPSIHGDPLNPNINFDGTPFYLQKELSDWKREIVEIDGKKHEFPRRAAINSFGAGGVNANLIVEEYIPRKITINNAVVNDSEIVLFSAKSPDRLLVQIEQMLDFTEEHNNLSLEDIAYTLQIGREAMEYRVAIVVENREELIDGMREYLNSIKEGKSLLKGMRVFTNTETYSENNKFLSEKRGDTDIQKLLAEKNYIELAHHWIDGNMFPWDSLHHEGLKRISLPTYPFEKSRYWIPVHKIEYSQDSLMQYQTRGNNYVFNTNDSFEEKIKAYLIQFLSHELRLVREQINLDKDIQSFGIDSIVMMKLIRGFEKEFYYKIAFRDIQEYRTIISLSSYLAGKINYKPQKAMQEINERDLIDALEKFRKEQLSLLEIEDIIGKYGFLSAEESSSSDESIMHQHNIEKQDIEMLEKYRNGQISLEEIEHLLYEEEIN